MERVRGYWDMHCFNGLSEAQQTFLVREGYLEIGYKPEGECQRGAEVEITTQWDEMPGPRFYCLMCAIEYLLSLGFQQISGVPPYCRGQSEQHAHGTVES